MWRFCRPFGGIVPRPVKGEGRGVHAIALSRGRRSIREHMAQMRAASGAEHLRADHPEADVLDPADVMLIDRGCKTGPSCPGVEFCFRIEEIRATAHTPEQSIAMEVVVGSGEGGFGPFHPCHPELFGRKQESPLILRLLHPLHLLEQLGLRIEDKNTPGKGIMISDHKEVLCAGQGINFWGIGNRNGQWYFFIPHP